MKFTEINFNIKLLIIMLEGQKINSKGLIDINFLNESRKASIVGLKREIILFTRENRFEDLHNVTNICLVGIHDLYSEPQETSRGDAC
ncbi:unnamed protein product [Spirodela intermedia]|uniref:Uncharacterized protein n=1 Tax=Spirodela intermedia TaxID=51605 RepID=A0A7I8LAV0_SPIIN|nr:unnamed protein product [Spirodela intermedia]